MRKTKNKITTIQNQSHYIRKFLLLSAIVSHPRWHHGDQGTHNIRSQKDPIHRRMSRCIQLSLRFQHTKHGSGKEGALKNILWSKFQHLRSWDFQSCLWHLETTVPCSGSTIPWMRRAHYDLFPALSPHMSAAAEPWSAEQLGGEGSAVVPHSRSGDAQKTQLGGTYSAAAQSWSPKLPESLGKQTAIPAMWFKPAPIPACLNSQEVQVPALKSRLKKSFKSLKNIAYGFNKEEKQQLCLHPSICTYDYISKGYSKIICSFAFPNFALPNPSRFLCNSFGFILALVSLRWARYICFKVGLGVDQNVDKSLKTCLFSCFTSGNSFAPIRSKYP